MVKSLRTCRDLFCGSRHARAKKSWWSQVATYRNRIGALYRENPHKEDMKQLMIILSMLLMATVALGWRLTSTTTRKHRYEAMRLETNDLSNVGVLVYGQDSVGFQNKLSSLLTI